MCTDCLLYIIFYFVLCLSLHHYKACVDFEFTPRLINKVYLALPCLIIGTDECQIVDSVERCMYGVHRKRSTSVSTHILTCHY